VEDRILPGTDVRAIQEGFTSLTPLSFDLADHGLFDQVRRAVSPTD